MRLSLQSWMRLTIRTYFFQSSCGPAPKRRLMFLLKNLQKQSHASSADKHESYRNEWAYRELGLSCQPMSRWTASSKPWSDNQDDSAKEGLDRTSMWSAGSYACATNLHTKPSTFDEVSFKDKPATVPMLETNCPQELVFPDTELK